MAVGPVVRARHGRESSAEMRPLKNRDPEDPSSGGKEAGDTLLLGIPSNKRLALLITAVALVCLLFFMSGRSDDDGDLAERRAGGSERLDHSPLLSDGFGRTAVAPLPHTTGTGKGSYGGVQAADASSSLHHLPSPSAASSSLHRSSSAPSAPGRAPSPKAAPSPKTENSLGTGASKKGTLLNSVHGIADSKKKLMPPAEQDDDDDDEESPLDENEDEDEEGQGIDEDDEDDEDDQDDDEIVEHEDEDDKRSEEEMTEYANVMFDKMDKNENDRVSWKEYHKVIKNDVDFEDETTAEQREDFDEIDANKDGYISRDEMVRTFPPLTPHSVHRPRGAPGRVYHTCVRLYLHVCAVSRGCASRDSVVSSFVCNLLFRVRAPRSIFSPFLRHSCRAFWHSRRFVTG